MTRQNVDQLDEFKAIADKFGAQLRITRLRPSGPRRRRLGRAAPDRRPAAPALRLAGRPRRGGAHRRLLLPPLRLRRGAARAQPVRRGPGGVPDRPGRRRLRLPVRHPREFLAGNVRSPGGLPGVWQDSELFAELRQPQTGGRLPQLRVLRLLPGRVHGGQVLHRPAAGRAGPGVRARVRRAGAGRADRRRGRSQVRRGPLPVGAAHGPGRSPVPISIGRRPPASACDASPLAASAADTRLGVAAARA